MMVKLSSCLPNININIKIYTCHFLGHINDTCTVTLQFTIVKWSNSDCHFYRRHDCKTTLKNKSTKIIINKCILKITDCYHYHHKNAATVKRLLITSHSMKTEPWPSNLIDGHGNNWIKKNHLLSTSSSSFNMS